MVRETRHLWVGNLPDNIREDRIREHFKRYGRVQNVKLLGRMENATVGASGSATTGVCATVAFMDIKSASKAHNVEHVLDERTLTTEYYEPAAIPSAAGAPSAGSSPAGSGYSGSSSSVNSTPAPVTASRYHLSGEESAGNACAMAASAAAPATWRGTNDSATEYCRRGNTTASYSRYQRNNTNAPYATPPSNIESSRSTPHHRWYASGERAGAGAGAGAACAGAGGTTGGESTPSTPGGAAEARRRHSGSGSSRSDSSSPEPSDTSRASTPAAPPPLAHHTNHRTPPGHPHQRASTANGRPLAICVRNLPARSTDSSLKDGLYHEYKKHGKVVWVKVVGQSADRYAVVRFKKPSDVDKALEVSQDKLFFGCKISVAPHQNCDEDCESAKPYETDIDEYHPKATRTLFIGNLEKDVTQQQLREKFKHFGRIIEIDIKKGSGGGAGYAFCQYASISSVVDAIRAMDGEYVGGSRVKLGFGKPVATTCVWVDGLTEHTEKQVLGAVSRCGAATSVCVDRAAGAALVHFEQAAAAGAAVRELRRVAAHASAAEPAHPRLCVDYASRECQEAFYEQLEKHGGTSSLTGTERLPADSRYGPATRHDPLRFDGNGSRTRAPSFGRGSSRTRYSAHEHYDPVDYAADRRYRVYDELGSSPQTDEATYEDRLQSVVVSPHRTHRHRRDSSPEERKHSKERHRSVGGTSRRSRSGSRGERHAGRRRHRRRHDGSGSRAGTPLRDEPDAPPHEPRRPPRDRPPLPMSLPLPKFAVQLLRAAPPAPRQPPPPAPAPDSPPRPPSASSSSAGSAPHSPSLEERIRSLDEKYEKWSGSARAPTDPPDRSRLRHRLLEVDINEVKPSEVVRSLLAKRSVFDEDSERLEGAVRAPSPTGSPRARGSTPMPRALRYPFPSHVTPEPDAESDRSERIERSERVERSDRPVDPRLARMDRPERPAQPERLIKVNEADYRIEPLSRPRTPSMDKLTDICEKKTIQPIEKDRSDTDGESSRKEVQRRRNSCYVNEDDKSFKSIEGDILEALRGDQSSDAITLGSIEKDIESASIGEKIPASEMLKKTNSAIDYNSTSLEPPKSEVETSSCDKTNTCWIESNKQESVVQSEKSATNDFHQNTELSVKIKTPPKDDTKSLATLENKPEEIKNQTKNTIERLEESIQNNIDEEILSFHRNATIHLNSINSIDFINKIPEPSHEVKGNEKNDKAHSDSQIDPKDKYEKENIEHEKSHDKIKLTNNLFFNTDKKIAENEKRLDDSLKNERDKVRQNKERIEKEKYDGEKDKLKNKNIRMDKNEKEKKSKDDPNFHKANADRNSKKVEKDSEKSDERHRDSDKVKIFDEKPLRNDNHKKDRHEKDKSKHNIDLDFPNKTKKEEKHKHDRSKRESEIKRDTKKDIDILKNRKSSKDESSRDLCRKDSTDSSASRTSHDSCKQRDSDSNDTRDETRTKPKLCNETINKHDVEKDTVIKAVLAESIKVESKLRCKLENREEKDTELHLKSKVDSNLESTVTHKSKSENIEKQRHYSFDSSGHDSKRKERLNSCSSLPSNIGHKRRMSSQDSLDCLNDDSKKSRNDIKYPERRESKDSRSTDRHKTTKFNKGHFAKIIESKTKDDKKNQVKPPDDTFVQHKDTDSKEINIFDKTKTAKTSPKDDSFETVSNPSEVQNEELQNDFDFLATLELRSSEEDERQKAMRKEMKEKKRIQQLQQIQELQMQQDALQQAEIINKIKEDKKHKIDEKKKDLARDKRMSTERKSKDEKIDQKRKNRKQAQSSDTSDSDEPKKHSIFDIVDDGPTYISMYDKVKARSCKNMQKQEEEKRQEKIKAKFSQLKQSRAKREEKKRSSWDEDSDSEQERRKPHKASVDSSSDDDQIINNKKREKSHMPNIDYDHIKCNDYFSAQSNEEDSRNKLSRKNSRSRIMSDTSDEEVSKRNSSKSPVFVNRIKTEITSDSESNLSKSKDNELLPKESCDDKVKRTSLLNLFGKSDSDDSKLKSNFESENDYKVSFPKSTHDISSETESVSSNRNCNEQRKKHKKKQKKHKFSFSDEEFKMDSGDVNEVENKVKYTDKNRRYSNKKDRHKDKIRESIETDDVHDEKCKLKKGKKSPGHSVEGPLEISHNNIKKEGKMEDIFGPLSDDSDKETNTLPGNRLDFVSHNYEPIISSNNEKLTQSGEDLKQKEDLKRKKEKKRKDKRFFVKEDDNSIDVDAVSKAIEARLFADTSVCETRITVETIIDNLSKSNHSDGLFADHIKSETILDKHIDKINRENREKERKKKRKRNKEDRQSRKEHNFYHNEKEIILDKFDSYECGEDLQIVTNTMLLDIPLPNDEETKDHMEKISDSQLQSPSLPRLTDSPSLALSSLCKIEDKIDETPDVMIIDDKVNNDYEKTKCIEVHDIPMPPPFENIVQNICDIPLPKEPSPIVTTDSTITESIPIPRIEIDVSSEDSNENAVRSISNLDEDSEKLLEKVDTPTTKVDKKVEEKPRAIISQEETEDAVAALLGESFGGKDDSFGNCFEEVENIPSHQIEIESTTTETENIPEEDAEEMRQAVQNLNASEMEMKPDTPVSDNDLLLIDTDTEEADETPQDAIERLPINIIATNQALNNFKANILKTSEGSCVSVSKPKTTLVHSLNPENETNIKLNEKEIKIPLIKRDSIHHLTTITTSSGTPVITSWTLANSKLVESQITNIPTTAVASRDSNENKPKQVSANIVQIKSPQNQNIQINNTLRPITNANRVSAPYQVINQIIRPPVTGMQPPTIKIPDPHILYQKPQGIVISPRIQNDPKLQSPKASPGGEAGSSPRSSPRVGSVVSVGSVGNVSVVNTSSQTATVTATATSAGGGVTVVRVQPPLSPLGPARPLLSPGRPNSVLVQTQGPPLHFNRLPVTPVLAPISKQFGANSLIQQSKIASPNMSSSVSIQQKLQGKAGEARKNDQRNVCENASEAAKIILSPTRLPPNTNATVLAQNRLISMQNAVHLEKINSTLHLPGKVLISNKNTLNDKREIPTHKSENHNPFGSPPIIHVAGVNHSVAPIIQNCTKPIVCSLQQPITVSRGQNTNVIHSLNPQRLLTTTSISSVIQLDASKLSTSVLTMATIKHSTVLTKSQPSLTAAVTTSTLSKVVMTPVLLKTSTQSKTIVANIKKPDAEPSEIIPSIAINKLVNNNEEKVINTSENFVDKEIVKAPSVEDNITKCETDFEELLKDNTNEIKVTPEKKLEISVGNPIKMSNQCSERRRSIEVRKIEIINKEGSNDNKENKKQEETKHDKKVSTDNKSTPNATEDELHSRIEKHNFKDDDSGMIVENSVSTPLEHTQQTNTANNNSSVTNKDDPFIPKESISNSERKPPKESTSELFDSDKTMREEKNIDENDFWSAKDVNIESVIKKVDSLCSESSDLTVEKEIVISNENDESNSIEPMVQNVSFDEPEVTKNTPPPEPPTDSTTLEEPTLGKSIGTGKRGGRSVRGKKTDKAQDRVQTRQISKPTRGTSKRGRGRAKVDKKVKNFVSNNVNNIPGDVYDFHEDSGDESSSNKPENRPRLILTIKSPLSGQSNATPTSTLSIAKDIAKNIEKPNKDEKVEVFASPTTNTRKSRRLQEKDVQRSTVDDVIDDVIKSSVIQPRNIKDPIKKRAPRQVNAKTSVADKSQGSDTRKSPRGAKRTRDRSLSDTSVDSNEDVSKRDDVVKDAKIPKLAETVCIKPDMEPIAAPPVISVVATSTIITTPTSAPVPGPVSVPISIAVSAPVAAPAPVPVPVSQPSSTPIMKPPKKMISEISAKLAGAFDNAIAASSVPTITTALAERLVPTIERSDVPIREPQNAEPVLMMSSAMGVVGGDCVAAGEAAFARRIVDNVPGTMVPVGATEATDARGQSPALPHRPPSTSHRVADRATPILIRGGDGDIGAAAAGAMGAAGAAAGVRGFRGAYAGPASLPRGAMLPQHPQHPPHSPHSPHSLAKQLPQSIGSHHQVNNGSRVTITSVSAVSPQGQISMGERGMYPHFSHQHYQMYQQHFRATQDQCRTSSPYPRSLEAEGSEAPTPPLELRRPAGARVPRPVHSPAALAPAPAAPVAPVAPSTDRLIMYAVGCGRGAVGAAGAGGAYDGYRGVPSSLPPPTAPGPPHASQVPREADSLQMLLRRYPVMWQGLLALKNDSAAVQMHFVGGSPGVAADALSRNADGTASSLLRIAQRMRLEPTQLDQVHRKMKMDMEHCMLLALPCGRDHMDVLQQSTNLTAGFITYLQRKQAAGIVNVAPTPGHQQSMYTVHIFPSCDFANENLTRIAPDLMHRVTNIAHLLIVIATT